MLMKEGTDLLEPVKHSDAKFQSKSWGRRQCGTPISIALHLFCSSGGYVDLRDGDSKNQRGD